MILLIAAPVQVVAAEQAPAAWQAYAALAQTDIDALLNGDEPGAVALRDTLVTAADGTAAQRELVLIIGVDAASQIERAEIAASVTPVPVGADAQLKTLLLGRKLPGTPPVGMRQPMRLAVTVAPAPPEPDTNSKREIQ
ncbi:hypothetical protein OK349_03005 [Sphingomonas sp. BT-65]|uniref:hypothetical protein n=1 Tax=Sphingomonas sp. BT-65 TaxID=2989821 RepID=UPI002235AEAE|nr:hypothetical protein [Sphingomonas sp. BT-65]MCW4460660.1 hypothetical protein [Sphingomonas sp. BT-65]